MGKNRVNKKDEVREIFSSDEISILALVQLFYRRRKFVFYSMAIFFVIGALVGSTTTYEYTSQSRILSENRGSSSKNIGGAFSKILGLGGGGGSLSNSSISDLSTELYPEIIQSEPFLLGLMKEEFYFQETGERMTLQSYLRGKSTGHIFSKFYNFLSGMPSRFFRLFERKKKWNVSVKQKPDSTQVVEDKSPFTIANISGEEKHAMSRLKSRIEIESEGRIITLSVTMPEPVASAELNRVVLEKIIEYVVAYRTEKQRDNLRFIEERFVEAQNRFHVVQMRLADFRDSNRRISSARARTKQEQLESEYNLTFNIYKRLAQQLEEAKIQLKKDTPLFTEFEPVSVPRGKSEPNIPRTIILYLVMGAFLGFVSIAIVIFMEYRSSGSSDETEDQE